MFTPPHSLSINLSTFGFVQRERNNGKTVTNRCGRDFLYYALNYYRPDIHDPVRGNPVEIEKLGVFGLRVPSWLIWTFLSFARVPKYFSSLELGLEINTKNVKSFPQFLSAVLSAPPSFDKAIQIIEQAVDLGQASGVDIAVSLGGLADHVMFVYGYDTDNLYVIDTHQAPKIEYEKITPENDNRFIMRLSKSVIRKRWTRWNRVWVIRDTI